MSLFSSVRVQIAAATVAALLLVPAPALSEAGNGAIPVPPEALADVGKAIRAITTLKASFTQTDSRGGTATGTLTLKQPGHIRFDYGGGDLLIVADGKSLYMIDYEVAQQQRIPIRNSPLGALLDPTRDITRYGRIVSFGPDFAAVAVRDNGHPEYGTLTMSFTRKAGAPGGMELSGWQAKDAQGNLTNVRLTGHAYGVAVPNSAFTWRDPRPTSGRPNG